MTSARRLRTLRVRFLWIYDKVVYAIWHNGVERVTVLLCFQSGKFDMAGDLLKKCLQYHKVRNTCHIKRKLLMTLMTWVALVLFHVDTVLYFTFCTFCWPITTFLTCLFLYSAKFDVQDILKWMIMLLWRDLPYYRRIRARAKVEKLRWRRILPCSFFFFKLVT